MANDLPGSYCQNCLSWNIGERETCAKCGTRLLILPGDQTWEDEGEDPDAGEDLEEHLLERITGLEETVRRVETYLETVSDQLGKLERSEVMLRNGLMALVQEMEQNRQLDAHAFSERWEHLVEENLHLISAREVFTRYRARILPIARPRSMSQLKRALLETSALLETADLPGAAHRLGALPRARWTWPMSSRVSPSRRRATDSWAASRAPCRSSWSRNSSASSMRGSGSSGRRSAALRRASMAWSAWSGSSWSSLASSIQASKWRGLRPTAFRAMASASSKFWAASWREAMVKISS